MVKVNSDDMTRFAGYLDESARYHEREAARLDDDKQPSLAFVKRQLVAAMRLVAADLRGEPVTTVR